jgi:formamidopyrimidine-DNA glycosylase
MPELPEVEMARRRLVRWLDGREVVEVELDDTRIAPPEGRAALSRVRGALRESLRRGKLLWLGFERGGVASHLGMTGKWVRREGPGAVRFSRARLVLSDGSVLHYTDPRLFGRLEPLSRPEVEERFSSLGLDPLADTVTVKSLREALGKGKRAIKVALMDQARVAGLGNIHAAEALFRAGIHPERPVNEVTDAELKRLVRGIRETLDFGLAEQEGEEPVYLEEPGSENPFQVYGRAGEPCRRCRTLIESFRQAQRTTCYCPRCQPRSPDP